MGLVHRLVCFLCSSFCQYQIYCLVTGVHECEQLAQSYYAAVPWLGLKQSTKPCRYATMPPKWVVCFNFSRNIEFL